MNETQASRRPLEGVKVVEAGIALAGPFCSSLLADFGARVIKVERPDGGDPARLLGPSLDGTQLWWGVASRDKLCVALDLKQAEDRERFIGLIEEADVFVENYRPGVLQKLGLGWDDLSRRNPRLVMMSISGFGQTGPNAGRPGFGKIAEGLSGVVPVTGSPADIPLHVGFSLADTSAGLMGAMAITMALFQRDCRGGAGAHIDVGLYEPLFRMMELQLALAETTGAAPMRNGTNDPYGWGCRGANERRFVALRCRDGAEVLVRIDVLSQATIPERLGLPASPAEPNAFDAALLRWAREMTIGEVREALKAAGIEAARVHDGMSMAQDPYFVARGDVLLADIADGLQLAVPGHVPRKGDTRQKRFRAAAVGEDNVRVWKGAARQETRGAAR